MVFLFSVYSCSSDEDCHTPNGLCDEFETCQCIANWDSFADCSGKQKSVLSLMNLYNNIFSEFICKTNVDCNENGICTDQKCQCIPGWDSREDCTSK